MGLELDIADLFGSESSIFCSKEFWRALCVIFAFNERGDIIALNRRIDLSFKRTSKVRVLLVTLADSTIVA
jgi:7-keto-8-aminopelargonate synthetase-like enzyme